MRFQLFNLQKNISIIWRAAANWCSVHFGPVSSCCGKWPFRQKKKVRNVNELTCLASSKKVLMRCRSRIFSSSTKNKMKTLDPQIKTCTSVIWVVFVTLTKWESILRLLAEQYYFCDELLPSPNDFGQSNFLWKWSWWRNLPSLTWLLQEVSSEKFDFSLVFFLLLLPLLLRGKD